MSNPIIHHSAGGLVYRVHHREIELLMIKDSYGNWTFPKGHLEERESLEEAARREIAEETGLPEHDLVLKRELGEITYWFNSTFASDTGHQSANGTPTLIHKYVTYFLFSVDPHAEIRPQAGEIEAIEWVPLREVSERNSYEDNKEIITKATHYLASY